MAKTAGVALLAAGCLLLAGCGQHPEVATTRLVAAAPHAAETQPATVGPVIAGKQNRRAAQRRAATASLAVEPEVPAQIQAERPRQPRTAGGAEDRTTSNAPKPRLERSSHQQAGTPSADPGQPLWDRTFASVSVTENDRDRGLVVDSRLLVNIYTDPGDGVRWNGGCNTSAAPVRITTERLVLVGDAGSSAAHCGDARMDQEQWFTEFMDTGPAWELSRDGKRLRLSSGAAVIVLEEHPWPPPWAPYRSSSTPD